MDLAPNLTRDAFDAVLFDMDGVLTATATVHATAWQEMFDAYLKEHGTQSGTNFQPFDIVADYKTYVDGKARYDGAQSFLASRGIHLPFGQHNDASHLNTLCGLANRKDDLVNLMLARDGVEVYPDTLAWAHQARQTGFRTAVVSSSRNCQTVLQAGGIEELFDVRIDGAVADQLNLPGKPDPAMFLRAAGQLGISPKRAIIIEDAIAGVEAGIRGGFGLIIGLAREGEREPLSQAGAHVVVHDLSDLPGPQPG